MATTLTISDVQLKHGSGEPKPYSLKPGEPAVDLTNKKLYIGANQGENMLVFNSGTSGSSTGEITSITAENVYLSNSITVAGASIGNYKIGTIIDTNTSLQTILSNMFTKTIQPSVTEPYVSIATPESGSYEIGTEITPRYSATFNAGSYTYGPATGITAQTWEVTNNVTNESFTTSSGTFASFTVTDSTNFTITAKATHNAGTIAVDNLGNLSNPEKKIAEGTKSATSDAIKGYQRGYYIGTTSTKETTITSAMLRDFTKNDNNKIKNANYTAEKVSFTVPVGAASIIIACPADKTGMTEVINTTVNAKMTSSFVKSTVKVAGADNNTSSEYAKDYNVWVYSPAEAYISTANLTITLG